MYVELTEEQKAAQVRFSQNLPRSVPRYHPMGEFQEQRLIHMLDLDREGLFYKQTSMRDYRLMQSLLKRGLVHCVEREWFLSDAGKLMAEKLNPNDGLPF